MQFIDHDLDKVKRREENWSNIKHTRRHMLRRFFDFAIFGKKEPFKRPLIISITNI